MFFILAGNKISLFNGEADPDFVAHAT